MQYIKDILKRPLSSLLTLITVFIFACFIINASYTNAGRIKRINDNAESYKTKLIVKPLSYGSAYPPDKIEMDEEYANEILSIKELSSCLSTKVIFTPYNDSNLNLYIAAVDRGMEEAFTGIRRFDTTLLSGTETFSLIFYHYPVILGYNAWKSLNTKDNTNYRINDNIDLLGRSFTIIGILNESKDSIVNRSLIVRLYVVQVLLEKEGFVSSLLITPNREYEKEMIAGIIKSRFTNVDVITGEAFADAAEMYEINAEYENTIVCLVALIIAVILLTIIKSISIYMRRGEIRKNNAKDITNTTLIASVFFEAVIICIAGYVFAFGVTVLTNPRLIPNFGSSVIFTIVLMLLLIVLSGIMPAYFIIKAAPKNRKAD